MNNYQILMVEDDTIWISQIGKQVVNALRGKNISNYDLIKIDSLGKAIEAVETRSWHLLITDLGLGDPHESCKMTGKILIEISKEKNIPTIVVSGTKYLTRTDVRDLTKKFGVRDYFDKVNFHQSREEFHDSVLKALCEQPYDLQDIMTTDRLLHLQTEIKRHYEQLAGKESALTTTEKADKKRIEQQIDDVKQYIAKFEGEYWLLLKSQMARLDITDADADIVTAEIIHQVEILEYQPTVQSNAEFVKLLTEIKAALTKPEIPGSGKLKAAIPLLPGFLSYELELDTEGLLRRLFPTFSRLAEKLKKNQA
jgi:CheY-like chemotaxis protein